MQHSLNWRIHCSVLPLCQLLSWHHIFRSAPSIAKTAQSGGICEHILHIVPFSSWEDSTLHCTDSLMPRLMRSAASLAIRSPVKFYCLQDWHRLSFSNLLIWNTWHAQFEYLPDWPEQIQQWEGGHPRQEGNPLVIEKGWEKKPKKVGIFSSRKSVNNDKQQVACQV